mgnify:CR=1 FL=1
MDIKTLFKKFEARKTTIGNTHRYGIWWKDIKEIYDELTIEVVKIPLFAEDVIKVAKAANLSLFWAMNGNGKTKSFCDWIEKPENQETFARAWNEGYEVEEEKEGRYLVKLKATNQYLHVDSFSKPSFLSLSISSFGTEVTKTMLDNLGLSEVFSNPLFEVEEVK